MYPGPHSLAGVPPMYNGFAPPASVPPMYNGFASPASVPPVYTGPLVLSGVQAPLHDGVATPSPGGGDAVSNNGNFLPPNSQDLQLQQPANEVQVVEAKEGMKDAGFLPMSMSDWKSMSFEEAKNRMDPVVRDMKPVHSIM